jgi:hypothetical protein
VVATVRRGLRAVGTDRAIDESMIGEYERRAAPTMKVSDLVATITFWFVMGIAILLSLSALQIPELDAAIATIVDYLPNVIAARLILVVGFVIAGAVGALAERLAGDTLLGRIAETAIPITVVTIAISMALVQLKIAPAIVLATYIIVLGAVGLGLALAFGLGGREVGNRVLETSYQSVQRKMPQMQAEAETIGQRTQEAAAQVKEKVREKVEEPYPPPPRRRRRKYAGPTSGPSEPRRALRRGRGTVPFPCRIDRPRRLGAFGRHVLDLA